ncbi:MAG TPA: ribonuclease E activity regulator RraA [Gammaproteobacteria bacterium]|nr:ribonuclease E activity regulator RraA [Gammaproteobacteria bacterium]
MSPATTDLCDAHGDRLQVAEPVFRAFGARTAFAGTVATVKVFEDNVLVRETLEQPGEDRVLVVDGGGSTRCALLGDRLAAKAVENGWSGVVVYGCIRDSAEIDSLDLGVRALNVHPRKSVKRGEGQRDIPVRFAGLEIRPGAWLCGDADGIVVGDQALSA